MWLLILGLGAAAWASFPFGKSGKAKSRFPDTEKYVFLDMGYDGKFERFRKKDVRRYNKLKRVSRSPNTSQPEALAALKAIGRLQTKYPGIGGAAYLRPKLNPRRKNGRKRRRSRRGRR